jgi:hypothetical protein
LDRNFELTPKKFKLNKFLLIFLIFSSKKNISNDEYARRSTQNWVFLPLDLQKFPGADSLPYAELSLHCDHFSGVTDSLSTV